MHQLQRIGPPPFHQFQLPPRRPAQMHGPVAPGVNHRVWRQPTGELRKTGHGASVKGRVGMWIAACVGWLFCRCLHQGHDQGQALCRVSLGARFLASAGGVGHAAMLSCDLRGQLNARVRLMLTGYSLARSPARTAQGSQGTQAHAAGPSGRKTTHGPSILLFAGNAPDMNQIRLRSGELCWQMLPQV